MTFDLRFYWTLFLRRLPVMAALFLLCAGIGVALAIKLPTTYSTTARLLFEAPQISGLQVGGQANGAEQLERIQQLLMTRNNLIDVANEHDVFDTARMNPDDVVTAMRSATDIDRSAGRNRATLMSISFEADNPRTVRDVVNAYVTLVLEENTRQREKLTDDTVAFYEAEVDRLNTELNLQSERIVAFKSRNSNALPDSLEYRLERESQLTERVTRAEREIAALGEQRKRIIDVYEATGRIQAPQQQQLSPDQQRLAQLQAELENLKLVYSENHIRVRQVLGQISGLESKIAAAGGSTGEDTSSQEAILEIALAQIDGQVDSLQQTRNESIDEQAKLRISIDKTAENGIALDALERDYANAQSLYNAAILRRDQARIDQNAASQQLTGRIRVVENASLPSGPSSPNRPAVAAGGIAAGLVAMAALFMLLEVLNRTVRRPVELTAALGVTPLATIPYMETRRHFWMRRSLKLALLIAVVIAVPVGLWAVDTYYSPLDLMYGRLLARLGL